MRRVLNSLFPSIPHDLRFDAAVIGGLLAGTIVTDVALGLAFAYVAVVTVPELAHRWLHRRAVRNAQIASLEQRPVLLDYKRILLTWTGRWDELGCPLELVADADLILAEDDTALKDRHHAAGMQHPGLFKAAQALGGSRVIDMTDGSTRKRIWAMHDSGQRGGYWPKFQPEVVRAGTLAEAS